MILGAQGQLVIWGEHWGAAGNFLLTGYGPSSPPPKRKANTE